MSENIIQKALSMLGKAWVSDPLCPYQTPVGEMTAVPSEPKTIRPQAIGSAELIFGDVPFVPPELNR